MANQQTMTERDMYLAAFEQEYQTTLKLLKAYPRDKGELRPAPTSQTAREVAWTLVLTQGVIEPVLQGKLEPTGLPPAPATWAEIIPAFEAAHKDALTKLWNLKDDQLNSTIHMPTGPKQMGDVRRGDALWMFLHDLIHHRGQLSVYLRMTGSRVPSIYGPSGDEPWW